MMSWDQLRMAVEAAERRFRHVEEAYPELAMHLVYAAGSGQTGIQSRQLEIMQECPGMLTDVPNREAALKLANEIKVVKDALEVVRRISAKKLPNKVVVQERLEKKLPSLSDRAKSWMPHFRVREDTTVEIRFTYLKYDLIRQLRNDPLVDRALTPQTDASIRIVLGALESFIEEKRK